jgi:hypothetical protein
MALLVQETKEKHWGHLKMHSDGWATLFEHKDLIFIQYTTSNGLPQTDKRKDNQ